MAKVLDFSEISFEICFEISFQLIQLIDQPKVAKKVATS